MDLRLLWRWCYLQNLVLSVNIGCRDNLPVTTYIIKDTVRYFFMILFLRYTNWLVLPGKFILICNICSKYNVQTPPPPLFTQYKIWHFWDFQNFPLDHFHRRMILYIPVGDMCQSIHQQWQWEQVTWQRVRVPSRYHNTKHFSRRLQC